MKKRKKDFSDRITQWIGSNQSIVVHTVFFIVIFALRFLGFSSSDILLILTTAVSLEAIYLAIFIQMTVNKHSEDLEEVSEDIEELQEDVEEIQEDVEDIQEDVEDIQEDVEDISEEEDDDIENKNKETEKFKQIESTLQALLKEISELKKLNKNILD